MNAVPLKYHGLYYVICEHCCWISTMKSFDCLNSFRATLAKYLNPLHKSLCQFKMKRMWRNIASTAFLMFCNEETHFIYQDTLHDLYKKLLINRGFGYCFLYCMYIHWYGEWLDTFYLTFKCFKCIWNYVKSLTEKSLRDQWW